MEGLSMFGLLMKKNASPDVIPPVKEVPDSSTGGPVSTVIDAITNIVTWFFTHPIYALFIAGIVGVGYLYNGYRTRARTSGQPVMPLSLLARQSFRLWFIEDTRPVFGSRVPRSQARFVLPALFVFMVVVVKVGGSVEGLGVAGVGFDVIGLCGAVLVVVTMVSRASKVIRSRRQVVTQMFNVASAEFRYGKSADMSPWNFVSVTGWTDLFRPQGAIVSLPAGYNSSEERNRAKFERNFSESVSDTNTFTFTWESAKNRVVAEPTPFITTRADYPAHDEHPWNVIPLGIGEGGKEVVYDLSVAPHALVCGPTGGGKSVTQRTMLLHTLKRPDEWRIVLIDPKRVELMAFKDFENVIAVETVLEDQVDRLGKCEQEMMRRYDAMTAAGVNHFRDLPLNSESGLPLPALLIMVDETYALLAPENIKSDEGKERDNMHARCTVLIGSIARLGRAAGVHLILASQRPDAAVIPGEVRNNLDARIACARMDTTPSLMVLDSDAATRLPAIKGRAMLRMSGSLSEYQGYFLTQEEVAVAVTMDTRRYGQETTSSSSSNVTGKHSKVSRVGSGNLFTSLMERLRYVPTEDDQVGSLAVSTPSLGEKNNDFPVDTQKEALERPVDDFNAVHELQGYIAPFKDPEGFIRTLGVPLYAQVAAANDADYQARLDREVHTPREKEVELEPELRPDENAFHSLIEMAPEEINTVVNYSAVMDGVSESQNTMKTPYPRDGDTNKNEPMFKF
jgi:hypothetical protein